MTALPDGVREVVFDTGPLSHLSKEGWLGIVRMVLDERTAVIPDVVEDELKVKAHEHGFLHAVLQTPWIECRTLQSDLELEAFAQYSARLVAKGRNVGEAGVLAYASSHRALAVIDDGAGRRAARDTGVHVIGTLGLLVETIRLDLLSVAAVSHVADALVAGEYRLPFEPGGFAEWYRANF